MTTKRICPNGDNEGGVGRSSLRWTEGHFVNLYTNSISNPFVTLTASDTTPSVASYSNLKLSFTTSTTVTNFDDGRDGQEIFLLAGNTNTVLQHGSGLVLAGADDFHMGTNDTLTMRYTSTYWYEKCRSTNS